MSMSINGSMNAQMFQNPQRVHITPVRDHDNKAFEMVQKHREGLADLREKSGTPPSEMTQEQLETRLERLEDRSAQATERFETMSANMVERFATMEAKALENGNEEKAAEIALRAEEVTARLDNAASKVTSQLETMTERVRAMLESTYESGEDDSDVVEIPENDLDVTA